MKILNRKKIRFVNEDDQTTKTIKVYRNTVIPRIGEKFELCEDGRCNIITEVYHSFHENEITIYYDFFMAYKEVLQESGFDTKRNPKDVIE